MRAMGFRHKGFQLMRHRFHAICPYFAMFPEGFVARWIERLTLPGDLVADPFCGRGTTPFQALLMERRAFGMDVNPVAYCVTRAKTNAPSLKELLSRLSHLEEDFGVAPKIPHSSELPEFFQHCFDSETLLQILYLRKQLDWRTDDIDAMLTALTLGSLHGDLNNAGSYLSNQMPRTISTKPAYSVRYWKRNNLEPPKRDVFDVLQRAAVRRYASDPPKGRGHVERNDVRTLSRFAELYRSVDCVITSPPYFDTTNFEEDQWLRLWFLGGPPRPTKNQISRDDRHESRSKYWAFIGAMWRALGHVVRPGGNVVVRLGGRDLEPEYLAQKLEAAAMFAEREVVLQSKEVSELRNRQTDAFRPGSRGCRVEIDCHFVLS